jgi:DNA-directed RNA polymerase alpha subunit
MSKDFDSSDKFGAMFPNLNGLNLDLYEAVEWPVRVYNFLKRAKVNTLQDLLSMSIDDLNAVHRRAHTYIEEALRELSESYTEHKQE